MDTGHRAEVARSGSEAERIGQYLSFSASEAGTNEIWPLQTRVEVGGAVKLGYKCQEQQGYFQEKEGDDGSEAARVRALRGPSSGTSNTATRRLPTPAQVITVEGHCGKWPPGAEARVQSRKVHALDNVPPRACQAHSLSLGSNHWSPIPTTASIVLPFSDKGSPLKGAGSTTEGSRIKEPWGQNDGWC